MTAFDYTTTKATANKLLVRFGQSLTISHAVLGVYNTDTGTVSNTVTTQTASGAIFEWSPNNPRYGTSNIPASLILDGDKQLYLSALGITAPNVNDTITDVNGKSYVIIMIKPLAPSGVNVLYEMNIRGT